MFGHPVNRPIIKLTSGVLCRIASVPLKKIIPTITLKYNCSIAANAGIQWLGGRKTESSPAAKRILDLPVRLLLFYRKIIKD
jgi:hypothetical protein